MHWFRCAEKPRDVLYVLCEEKLTEHLLTSCVCVGYADTMLLYNTGIKFALASL